MADNFGLKIGLEGEKEFKKALADINQSFKVLGSEMKVVESQFGKNDNSVEALTARNQVLNKEIEAQKQRIETLRAALENASSSFGENDRRTCLMCCWKRVFVITSAFSWQNSVSLFPASFCASRPNLPVTPGIS